ncbi:hypothetical protein FKP32DRAFT_1069145 [Trametes sanguinea]|nr:hypothetical protein FKP32DRAFT_1069145 [Trametes sanguinea]
MSLCSKAACAGASSIPLMCSACRVVHRYTEESCNAFVEAVYGRCDSLQLNQPRASKNMHPAGNPVGIETLELRLSCTFQIRVFGWATTCSVFEYACRMQRDIQREGVCDVVLGW